MRILLAVLAGLLVVSGVVIHGLRGDLQSERQKNAELQARLSRSPAPVRKSAGLSQQTEVTAQAALGATPPAGSPEASPDGDASDLVEVSISEMSRRAVSRARQDPEYQQAERVIGRGYIMGIFPGVAADLGLSREEARRFYDLLFDQRELQEGPPDAALAALLGATRLARWEEFQRTVVERRDTDGTVKQLAMAGLPLDAAQERGFIAAEVAERQHQVREMELLADRARVASASERVRLGRQMDDLELNAEVRIVEAAAPHLNAEQLALLRENVEAHRTKMRVMRRLQKEGPLLPEALR